MISSTDLLADATPGLVQHDAIALYRSSVFIDIPECGFYASEPLIVPLAKLSP